MRYFLITFLLIVGLATMCFIPCYGQLKLIKTRSGQGDNIHNILQDKKGNIWFGTEAGDPSKRETEGGVWRYDGKNFKNLLKKDGLIDNGAWSILEGKAGNIWIGTRKTGLCRFDGKIFTSFSE